MFAYICGARRVVGVLFKQSSRMTIVLRIVGQNDTRSFKHAFAYRTASCAVSAHTLAAHQRRKEVKVTPLVYPSVTCSQFRKSGQTIGNKRSNLLPNRFWQGIEDVAPHTKALSTFDKHWIKEIHVARPYGLHCHEVQHPLSSLKREVHTIDNKCVRTGWKTCWRFGNERFECVFKASRNTTSPQCAKVRTLITDRVTIKENAFQSARAARFGLGPRRFFLILQVRLQ